MKFSQALLLALLPCSALGDVAVSPEETLAEGPAAALEAVDPVDPGTPVNDDLKCKKSLLRKVPHLEEALTYVNLPAGEFTFFAPSEKASVRLTQLLAAEGCKSLPVETLEAIIASGIVPEKYNGASLRTQRDLVPVSTSPTQLKAVKYGSQVFIEVFDPADTDEAVDVVSGSDLNTRACGGRAIVHLLDDIIVPPALVTAVGEASADPASQVCPTEVGHSEPTTGDVPTDDALTTGVNIDLSAGSTNATTEVDAEVTTSAVDENGNELPIDETLLLGVDASLQELSAAGANNVNVEVPVSVNVWVDPGSSCEGATISVPVFVSVGIQLLVDGKPLGSGNTDLNYLPCTGQRVVGAWKRCAGERINKRGAVKQFRRGCAEGLQCVKKEEKFAACMPTRSRGLYMRNQGWDGTVLKCKPKA